MKNVFPGLLNGGVKGEASPDYSAVPKSQELGSPIEIDFPATFFLGGVGGRGLVVPLVEKVPKFHITTKENF